LSVNLDLKPKKPKEEGKMKKLLLLIVCLALVGGFLSYSGKKKARQAQQEAQAKWLKEQTQNMLEKKASAPVDAYLQEKQARLVESRKMQEEYERNRRNVPPQYR
jgi:uncharacterized protein HemX